MELEEVTRYQCRDEIARDRVTLLIHEKDAVGIAIPCHAEIGALLLYGLHKLLDILPLERIGAVVGEGAVRIEIELCYFELRHTPEYLMRGQPAHAVACIGYDGERLDLIHIYELHQVR